VRGLLVLDRRSGLRVQARVVLHARPHRADRGGRASRVARADDLDRELRHARDARRLTRMPERDEFPDYLALERTFLAWVRTGLALMGFGFVVARFGLFLRELQALPQDASSSSPGLSVWFGTALILMGVAANVLAAWRHRQLVRQLDRGEIPRPG